MSLDVRKDLAGRLDNVAAHVLDPDTRLRAHLWACRLPARRCTH
jgi:hypothetical protein